MYNGKWIGQQIVCAISFIKWIN